MKVADLKPGDVFTLLPRKNAKKFIVSKPVSGSPVRRIHKDNNFQISENHEDYNKFLVLVNGCRQLVLPEETELFSVSS